MLKNENLSRIDNLIFGMLALLIFVGPLWRGYYGEGLKPLLTFFLGLAMVLYFVFNLNSPVRFDKIDLLACLFILVNIASLFTAVNLRAALGETLLTIGYVFCFYYFRRTVPNKVVWLFYIVFTAATLVAMLGIANFGGLINLQGGLYYGRRLQSTLQYANTTAIFLLINYLFGIFMLSINNYKPPLQYLLTVLTTALSLAIFLTYSRGVFLLALPLAVLLLMLYKKELSPNFIFNLFITLSPSILLIQLYVYLLKYNLSALAWVTFFSMLGLACLGRYLLSNNWLTLEKLTVNQIKGGLNNKALLAFVFVGLTFLALGIYLDNPVIERVKTIVTKTSSLEARLEIYQDALKIIKDHPIFGLGEKGWESLYPSYQTKPYIANEVHSQLLKVGVNNGIIGMLIYAGFWLYGLYHIFAKARKNHLLGFILAATLGLILHSLFDFNLSLPAISLIIWSFLGSGINLAQPDMVNTRKAGRGFNYLLFVMAFGLCFSSGAFYLGYWQGEKGLKLVNQQEIDQGIKTLKLATSLDPFAPRYHLALAKIYEVQTPTAKNRIFEEYEKAYILAPYSFETIENFGQFLLDKGHIPEGLSLLDRLPKLRPLQYTYYPSLAGNYLRAADYFISNKDYGKALVNFQKIINLYYHPKKPQGIFTSEIYFVLAQARYYNGQYPDALAALKASTKGKRQLPPVFLMWKALILDKLNQPREVLVILNTLKTLEPKVIQVYQYIREQKANLEKIKP